MTAAKTPDPIAAPAPRAAPARPAPRSLLPREHGAWGQLGLPLAAALAQGRPGAASWLLTAAVVLAFLAHEPLLVLLGQRGRRVADEEGPRARRWLAAQGALAAATGLAGLGLAPAAARLALLVPATLAVVVIVLLVKKLEKTVPGEVTVAAALASAAFGVALAGGVSPRVAVGSLAAWVLAFAAATVAVEVILVRVRSKGERDPGRRNAVLAALLGAAAFALPAAGLPGAVPYAVLPTAALSVVVCLAPISPKRLRTLGWALVASSTATFVVLVLAVG